MKLIQSRVLRGPNLWSKHPSIEALLSFDKDTCLIEDIPEFESRLRERFPEIALRYPACKHDVRAIAQVLEFAALGLQTQIGCPVTFGQTISMPDKASYRIIVEYSEEAVGQLAFQYAYDLCIAAIKNLPFGLNHALQRMRTLYEDIRLGPSTGAIVKAAIARGIPYRRLTNGSLVQFGWGSKQRRIQATESDATNAIAESIVQDKQLTKLLLQAAGIPVPLGRCVINTDDAWITACEIGLPVVIKPKDGNHGRGVAVNLMTEQQVKLAFSLAATVEDEVIVEQYIGGSDYRLLVVNGKVIAAARRDPPQVIGNGIHTINQLVEQINRDPLRSEGHTNLLSKVHLDQISLDYLATQDYSAESVPSKGVRVILRNNANLSTGGTATDVTDDVHPEIFATAVATAKMTGLDICGIDIICDSIRVPLEEQRGAIIEVNAAPGLRMHLQPSFGRGRAVGESIIDYMFTPGENGRIPVVAVTGTNGKTTTVRLITHMLTLNGMRVGMTCTDGIFVDGDCIDTGDCSGPKSAKNVLFHPGVDAAVLETARGGLLREGLGFDRCDVAVVTNVGRGDHLGLAHINTSEEVALVKRAVIENVTPQKGFAILNADDPLVVKMADHCPGSVIYFTQNNRNPVILTHRIQQQRVIYLDNKTIVASGADIEQRFALSEIPLTKNGLIRFQIQNAMAAIAAGWALGIDWTTIRAGLANFVSDAQTVPGRFNFFDYRNATLIADYGHNPDAIEALVDAIDNLPAKKRIIVLSAAGDRRNEDIRLQTQILGDVFDEIVLYQDQCQRGRSDGEVLGLLREGLEHAKRVSKVREIHGEFKAIDTALTNLQAGELCLILVDQVEQSLNHIRERVAAAIGN
ncbi:MAG: cyanophycin synthetase [Nitrosomonas sp.]|nr:cyanophycin synthetase [Nitrosomonas sp.]